MKMTDKISRLLKKGKTAQEIAAQLKIKPNRVYTVKWLDAKKQKPSKIIKAVQETKAAMDAIEKKPKRKRRITRKQLLKQLQPGLDALFGLEYKKTVNFAQQKDGTIVDLDEGGKVISSPDPVNHPPHYKSGGIETIDFIEAKDLNYRLGNVVKYVSRAGRKAGSDPVVDLEKAAFYLKREIDARKSA